MTDPTFCLGQDNGWLVLEKTGRGRSFPNSGCQLWLKTAATLGVSNSFRLDGCFIKSCKLLYEFMEESLQWRIGSQDSPIHKMALHRQIIKSLGYRRMARWVHMFVVQARCPEFRSRYRWENPGIACIACNFSTGSRGTSLGFSDCQLSSKYRDRPCLKGLRHRMVDQNTQHLPVASMYEGTYSAHKYVSKGRCGSEKK